MNGLCSLQTAFTTYFRPDRHQKLRHPDIPFSQHGGNKEIIIFDADVRRNRFLSSMTLRIHGTGSEGRSRAASGPQCERPASGDRDRGTVHATLIISRVVDFDYAGISP
jgi:hypothetical protein